MNVADVFTLPASVGFEIASSKSGNALTINVKLCVFVGAPGTAALIVTGKIPAAVPADAATVRVTVTGLALVGETDAEG